MRRLMIFCGLDGEAQARCCDLSEEGWDGMEVHVSMD
jgi:hypothetical protein